MIEIMAGNRANKVTLMSLSPQCLTKILQFLSEQDLMNIINVQCPYRLNHSIFWKLAKTKLNFLKYIHKSNEFTNFLQCNESTYLKNSSARLPILALNQNSNIFYQISDKFNIMIKQCSKMAEISIRNQFEQKLQMIYLNPYTPMAGLQRQVGTKTASNFQKFLLHRCNNPHQLDYSIHQQKVFSHFQLSMKKLEQNETFIKQNVLRNRKAITELRQYPFQITFHNRESKFIDNELHNLIVSILAMNELQLSVIAQYLSTISDPFELMLQLSIKYHQFIMSLIQFQVNLGFVFQLYDNLQTQDFDRIYSQKFCYWKPALVMWIRKMNVYNVKCQKIFAALLHESIGNQMEYLLQEQDFLPVAQKWRYVMKQNSKLASSELNLEGMLYEQISSEYQEIGVLVNFYCNYLVDLSINEYSIYTCGYSQQQLGPIFTQVQQYVIDVQQSFTEILANTPLKEEEIPLFKQLLQRKIDYYGLHVVPKLAASVTQFYNNHGQATDLLQRFKRTDEYIERYIRVLISNKILTPGKQGSVLYNLAIFKYPATQQNTTADNSIQTEQSSELEYYESDSEMDIEEPYISQHQIQMLNYLSKSIS